MKATVSSSSHAPARPVRRQWHVAPCGTRSLDVLRHVYQPTNKQIWERYIIKFSKGGTAKMHEEDTLDCWTLKAQSSAAMTRNRA